MKHFALRLNETTFETIQKLAREQERSVNGQINILLREYLEFLNSQKVKKD